MFVGEDEDKPLFYQKKYLVGYILYPPPRGLGWHGLGYLPKPRHADACRPTPSVMMTAYGLLSAAYIII